MKTIYMMCGLPRTGKSTWCANLGKSHPAYNKQVVSRDTIREGLFGGRECVNFEPQVTRVHDAILLSLLESGQTVIVDNTHLTYKRRKPIYELAEKFGYNVEIIRTYANIDGALYRARERYGTSMFVLDMLKNQDISMIEFYDIPKHPNVDIKVYNLVQESIDIKHYYDKCYNFEQGNPHHKDDLLTHLNKVAENCTEAMTGMFHDMGKLYTKVYDKEKQCYRYFGHERVSTYILNHYIISNHSLDFAKQFDKTPTMRAFKEQMNIKYNCMLFAVANHMTRHQEIGKSLAEKIYLFKVATGIPTQTIIDRLCELWRADRLSHGAMSDAEIQGLDDKKTEVEVAVNDFIRNTKRK